MQSRIDPRRLLLFLLTLLLVPAIAVARDAPTGADAFGEVIEVRVVNVEVVVTDRDGNRVRGLGPDDFRLFVDGRETPIDYFTEIADGRAVAPAEDRGAVRGVPAAAPGEAVGTSYLVFIDDHWSLAHHRNRVLEDLADDLDALSPGDRVAVVAFDGRRVDMLTSWTDSPRELRRVLSQARERPAFGLQRLAELSMYDRDRIAETVDPTEFRRYGGIVEDLNIEQTVFAKEVADHVERSVEAAVAAIRGFARPPGRKVMLLLSGGWPFSPASYVVGNAEVVFPGRVDDREELLEPLVDAANLVGYTVYPVDVPGLGVANDVDVGRAFGAGELGDVMGIRRERIVEDTLRHVAAETGGEPLINAAGSDPLATVARDVRSYYWLGFSPDRRRDDERHRIRVEATRPGLRVRARDSFRDLSREAERAMAVESALLFGDPAAEDGLAVEVGETERAGRRFMMVPLEVAIPTDLMTVVPEGEHQMARLELRLAALDDTQRQSEIVTIPVELGFDEEPVPGKVVPYRTTARMRRAEQVLVVSVTDRLSGRSLSSRVEIVP